MKVYVKTPCRLHMGLVDVRGNLGRVFGSVGVALSMPNVVLLAERSRSIEVEDDQLGRVKEAANRILKLFGLKTGCRIEVRASIPAHVGLGSGTQTALASATAVSKLYGFECTVEDMAVATGRASISSVGIGAFKMGGFIADAGYKSSNRSKRERSKPATIVFRHPLPKHWLFVVAVPNLPRGASGREEKEAFQRLPDVSDETVGQICRLIYTQMMPSLIEQDIEAFGKALTKLQIVTGECFKPIQGGVFCSREVEEYVKLLLEWGAYGAGQSSWGPTTYGLADGMMMAERLKRLLLERLERGSGGTVFISPANNSGAVIRITR